MMGWGNDAWGMGWFGGIFMVLFWVAVIAGVVLVVRSLTRDQGPQKPDPLGILKERYARGEITTQEYEERKKKLEG